MIRDKKQFDQKWFSEVYDYYCKRVVSNNSVLSNYDYYMQILLMKYTRVDSFDAIKKHFEELISLLVTYKQKKYERRITDIFDFKHLERDIYPLLAFAIALPISDDTWKMLTDIYPEGRDYITDRLIATRTPARKITNFNIWSKTAPAHHKYFKLLGEALDIDDKEEQIKLIQKHLEKWHQKKWRDDVSIGSDPDYPKKRPRYYGQFSYEVAVVVMAFDIDDSSFKEDIYYPKELVEYYRQRT